MNTVITSMTPVTLFGQEVPGMMQLNSGDRVAALVKRDGAKSKVLSIGDKHGGSLKQLGVSSKRVSKAAAIHA